MADVRSPVEVLTFGCRLNMVESDAIRRAAEAGGQDNLVVVNTCAVTAEAVRQARQQIRRLRRERPDVRIVVTGCAAQAEPDLFAGMAEVDQIIGNDLKEKPDIWAGLAGGNERIRVNDIMAVRETAGHLVQGIQGRTRGFVQVQNGCDHRCTFCIIPFGRGNSRSVPMGEVVAAVRRLADTGVREVVLTGVDLTSYGADLPGAPRLGKLVCALLRHVPDLERLRLSSIDSIEVDADLMAAIAGEERLMPHLHLSLQAGDDLILKRMKRRHSRDDAIRFCEDVRRLRPDIVFGADIIAGFPTETDEMFTRSIDLVEACGLTHLHVFPFSPRKGTPAANMPQVDRVVVKARASRLRMAGAAALVRHLDRQVGRTLSILTEMGGVGRAPDFTPVRLDAATPPGDIITSRVVGHEAGLLQIVRGDGCSPPQKATSPLGALANAGYRAIP